MDKCFTKWYGSTESKVFKTRIFARWARRNGLTDAALLTAVAEMGHGLVDGNLGGFVYKKRIGLPGLGKRGAVRTIVATRTSAHCFFLYGFAKNKRSNVSQRELKVLQVIAAQLLGFNNEQLEAALVVGEIVEVTDEAIES